MRAFGTEISGNRMRNGELSVHQRDYILAQCEAGCSTKEIATAMFCSQRTIQKTIQRWNTTSTNNSRPRAGRPPILSWRDRRLLLRIAKKYPKIEYRKLL
ncbi:hypothetical protein BDW02DRAFT_537484, partial [Decorospora gaudefroyi]